MIAKFIVWPEKDRQKKISSVLAEKGFNDCVGLVDGNTIPLYQRPASNGEVYWDQKK